MSVEIYNKARIIHKDGTFYYFLKHHSKNDCVCGGQVIVDDNFNNKYISRNSRAGSWDIIAHSNENDLYSHKIAMTLWNCPASSIYGVLRFAKLQNIALYFAKQASKRKWDDYNTFNDEQKANIDEDITYYNGRSAGTWKIDLSAIPAERERKSTETYCDKVYELQDNKLEYMGQPYWNLNNL